MGNWLFFLVKILVVLFIFARIFVNLTLGKCKSPKCLVGKVALVTGGNRGIGYETVKNLAMRGCKVYIADIANGTDSCKRLSDETGNSQIYYKFIDLSSLQSIREFVTDFLSIEAKLDILVNNAGCAGFNGVYTTDGLLKIMAINYFGPFLLTTLLADSLKKSKKARVIFVSSASCYLHFLKPDTLNQPPSFVAQNTNHFQTLMTYTNSKLAVLVGAKFFARKLSPFGVTVASVSPGAVKTQIFDSLYSAKNMDLWTLFQNIFMKVGVFIAGRDIEDGATQVLDVTLDDRYEGMKDAFVADNWCLPLPKAVKSDAYCRAVWKETERLVRLTDKEKL